MLDECRRFRRQLASGRKATSHARSCADCRQFADNWEAIGGELSRASEVTPPPGFAQQVRARLPQPPHPVVVMALRVLPATLMVMAALGIWVTLNRTATIEPLSTADDYLAWMVEDRVFDPNPEQSR